MTHDTLTDEETGDPIVVELFGVNGEPVSISKWAEQFRKSSGLTDEVDGHLIMTRWTGVDVPDPMNMREMYRYSYSRWEPNAPPLIFKTVVLNEDMRLIDAAQYSSKADAVRGHLEFIEKYTEKE